MNAEVREMPEYNVAYVRKMGAYNKNTCEQAFGVLMQWAGPRGYLGSGVILGLYWDNPDVTPPDKCRIDACVSVPHGTIPEKVRSLYRLSAAVHMQCVISRFSPIVFSRDR